MKRPFSFLTAVCALLGGTMAYTPAQAAADCYGRAVKRCYDNNHLGYGSQEECVQNEVEDTCVIAYEDPNGGGGGGACGFNRRGEYICY